MTYLQQQIALWVSGLVIAVTTLVLVVVAPDRVLRSLKGLLAWLLKWLPILILAGVVVVFLFVLPIKVRPEKLLRESALPEYFVRYYWYWVLVTLLGLGGSVWVLRRGLWPGAGAVESGGPLDEVWRAVLARLGQARIDLARQRVHVILAPDEEAEGWAAALVPSADLRLFAQAPDGPAPLHAYAVPEGVLLSCDGAWATGRHGEGAERVLDLGRKLRARGPDRPVISGLAVVFPMGWARQPQAVDQAAVSGEQIRILYDSLQVRCPVLALFPGLETIAGGREFIRRLAAAEPMTVDTRVGFDIPASHPFDRNLAQGGIDWIASWFHAKVLDLLAGKLFDYRENAELVRFDLEFRNQRARLAKLLDLAFSPLPHDDDTILFRGSYFTATSGGPGRRAFSVGLFRGSRQPLLAPRKGASWTEGAVREDARYHRVALGLAIGVGLAAALAWWKITRVHPVLGGGGVLSLVLTWLIVLLWPRRTAANRSGEPGAVESP
jgi:type VI secretion system protein ImpL